MKKASIIISHAEWLRFFNCWIYCAFDWYRWLGLFPIGRAHKWAAACRNRGPFVNSEHCFLSCYCHQTNYVGIETYSVVQCTSPEFLLLDSQVLRYTWLLRNLRVYCLYLSFRHHPPQCRVFRFSLGIVSCVRSSYCMCSLINSSTK